MATSSSSPLAARFDQFQFELSSGRLLRFGERVPIQDQPIQVLRLLLEADGKVVTREQLRTALWPEDTFVDFEHGVNTAVKKLRQALEDSAEDPKYIETEPKVGYRFIAPVEWLTDAGDKHRLHTVVPMALPGTVPVVRPTASRRKWKLIATAVTVALAVATLAYFGMRPAAVPTVKNFVQLTHDGQAKWLVGTDGTRLYLGLGSPESVSGIGQVSVKGGDPRNLATPSATVMLPLDVSADGSELLVVDMHGSPYHGKFWSLPVVGGEPRRLGDTEGRAAAWSPNGKFLAYCSGSAFFVAQADGSEPRKLATTKVFAECNSLTWSPDGPHLQVQAIEAYGKPMVLWDVPTGGGEIHRLVPGGASLHDDFQCCGSWTADGRYFVFASRGQIWALPRKGNRFHPNPDPIQLTSSPMWLATPVPSKDGKKLFVNGSTRRGELLRYEAGSGQFVPFLGGISAEYVDFSRDGQWAAYVSYPEGTLWRSKVDGSERLQLAAAREFLLMPRWSPDGKRVAYFAVTAGKPARIYEVSSEGGTPRQLVPDDPAQQFDPNWSPDGGKIVFGGASDDPASTIRVLDLATRQVSTLPASQGLYSPRWSPDGRYLVAQTGDATGVELFDFQTGKWTELAKGTLGPFPNWSKDGRYVYALALSMPGKVLRVRIADRKIEEVADMKTLTSTGSLALAPDDSILLLRDIGTEDIYSLDWEAP